MSVETTNTALRRNLHRIKTEGLDAATDAAITLLRDPNAPSQAKSAIINAVFRSAGLFSNSDTDDEDALQPHEMTSEQLNRAITKLRKELEGPFMDEGDGTEE